MARSLVKTYAATLDVDGLAVRVVRKRQKNMYVRVKPPDARVEVTAPLHFTDSEIAWFIREKKDLILKHRAQVLERERARAQEGSLADTCGRRGGADASGSGRGSGSRDGDARGSAPRGEGADAAGLKRSTSAPTQAELAEWRAVVEAFTPALIEKWAPIIGVRPGKLAYRNMVSRWGSCNVKTGHICINVQLATHPPECLEYVVVHELCHLLEANHGPRFKALLDAYLPHWREAEAKLKGGIRW